MAYFIISFAPLLTLKPFFITALLLLRIVRVYELPLHVRVLVACHQQHHADGGNINEIFFIGELLNIEYYT